MVHSEYTSMALIYRLQPRLAPQPLAWGSYVSVPNVHFLLCEFRPMKEEVEVRKGCVPGVDELARAIAAFHMASSNSSDTDITSRQYGNDLTTYHGNVPVEHGWYNTWEEYFSSTTKHLLDIEDRSRGARMTAGDSEDEEEAMARDSYSDNTSRLGVSTNRETLVAAFFSKVVPRLLRPIEASIGPTLIHGDLWHGNVGVDSTTGDPVIFDAASFWAHNECRCPISETKPSFSPADPSYY